MQVFLSYAASDKKLAGEVARSLSKLGYHAWMADEALLPGENWSLEIGKALEESGAMVALLSPDSAKSPEQNREIQYALASPKFQGRVVSVLVPPATRIPTTGIPWILSKLVVIPLGKSVVRTSRKIAKVLQKSQHPRMRTHRRILREKKYAISR